jgi:hypothetical protein
MTNIVPIQKGTALAGLKSGLLDGLKQVKAETVLSGGYPLLRLIKSGDWVFGAGNDPVQQGSHWAINPNTLGHGWSCWTNHPGATKNTQIGEVMVSVTEKKPLRDALPVHPFPWNEQKWFQLRCIDGSDEGVEVLYKTTSDGGLRAFDKLLGELILQIENDPEHPVPVVLLDADSYQHPKWGLTFKPLFTLTGWATLDGAVSEPELVDEADSEAPPFEPELPLATPAKPAKEPLQAAAPNRRRPAGR